MSDNATVGLSWLTHPERDKFIMKLMMTAEGPFQASAAMVVDDNDLLFSTFRS